MTKTKGLSKYAVSYRYPDAEEGSLTKEKVAAAVKLAKMAYDLVTQPLQQVRQD